MGRLLSVLKGQTRLVATTWEWADEIDIPRAEAARARAEEQLARKDLDDRELVNAATTAVAEAVPYHSAWHLWESPETAVAKGRGWSHQYNTALLLVLRRLGFDVRLVHAARVRGFGHPWFMSGHTWVKVHVGERWLDACASARGNRLGDVVFVPLTDELPMFKRTRWAVALALSPFVIATVWRYWLSSKPVPAWVFGERETR